MSGHEAGRASISLDGVWEFRHEFHQGWREIRVPAPWQSECSDLRDVAGSAIYRRRFQIPEDWKGREIALRFGAVNYFCTVSLNGHEWGRHEGGYLPFEIVLPSDRLAEDNRLEVAAILPTSEPERYSEYPFPEIPHGKQSWYGPLGGIWQSVTLEARHAQNIAACRIRTDRPSGRVDVGIRLSGSGTANRIRLRAKDPAGRTQHDQIFDAAGLAVQASFAIDTPLSWSPDHPNLYRLTLERLSGDQSLDRTEETFGFRTIEARDKKLLLNGEPLYLRGALDQDYYPDGICTPPSLAFLEDQLLKAKHLGLNCLRCHIKVPDPRYYEVADRLGMLIWTEIPNVERFTSDSARRLRETFEGILERDGNHPSIIAWTIINEDWGTRLTENPADRAWLAQTFDWVKGLDPTRLVIDNSACNPNFHVKTDIEDFHYYRSLPERREEWDRLTQEFAAGADWTFTPHGDGARTGDEPLVLSEFGVWGLPHPAKLREADGSEPWWMDYGGFWGDGAAYPHGIETRFQMLRLDRVFGSFDAFIEAAQWQQFRNLKYQIESVRAHPSIVGYVITELTDVHWEANGLLDLRRNPRVFHDHFAEVNGDIVIVPKLERRAFWADERITLDVVIATGAKTVSVGTTLSWSFAGQNGMLDVPATPALATSAPMRITIDGRSLDRSVSAPLALFLKTSDGAAVAKTSVDIALHVRPHSQKSIAVAAEPELAAYLAALGYAIADPDTADVVVSRGVDAEAVEAIRLGRRSLVLADRPIGPQRTLRLDEAPRQQPFLRGIDGRAGLPAPSHHAFPGLAVAERDGTVLRGDWISTFGWLRRDGAFADLPGGPLLDLSFERVVPQAVLTGFQPWEYESRVHAGVVAGWIHKPAAVIGERAIGGGKLVATTFRLTRDRPSADPVAANLFHALLRCVMR